MTDRAMKPVMNGEPKHNPIRNILPYLPATLAAMVALYSIFVLINWNIQLPQIVSSNTDAIPMAPSTALCFVLLGMAIFFRFKRQNEPGSKVIWQVLAALALLFNVFLLFQFISKSFTGSSPDIEKYLVAASWSARGYIVGRMSALTAALFILLCLNALFPFADSITEKMSSRWRQGTAMIVFFVASILIVGYWYNAPLLYGGEITPVAFSTSIGFLLLATCFLFEDSNALLSRWVTSDSVFLRFTRRVLPGTVGIILLFGWLELEVLYNLLPVYHTLFFASGALFTAGIVALLTFVTARQEQIMIIQTEQAMRESENKFSILFNQASLPTVLLSFPENVFVDVNEAWVQIFGYTREETLGRTSLELGVYPNADMRSDMTERVQQYNHVHNVEQVLFSKSGEPHTVLTNINLIAIEGQDYALISIQDITERKQAEDELRRRTQEAVILQAASAALTSSLELNQVLDNLLSQLAQVISYDSATVFLHKNDQLLVVAARGLPQLEKVLGKWFPADNMLISGTNQNLQPVIIADVQEDPRFRSWGDTDYVRGWMNIPLIVRGEVIGNLTVDSRLPNAYTENHARLALAFANQAAVAMENARLFEETRRRVAEFEVLYESSLTITGLLDPRQIAQVITEILSQKLKWHHAAVRLYHSDSDRIELLALHRPDADSALLTDDMKRLERTVHTGKGLSGWVIQHGEAVCSGNVNADPRYVETYPGIHSGLYVPMKLGRTVLGCISVESTQPDAFDEQDLRLLLTMAAQAAIAIPQAQLYEQVQQYASELEKRVEDRTADLQQANLDLARAARMKDEFLASMSHELRTPLTGILGLSESLQLNTYGELNEKQLIALKNIEQSGRHLLDLINDILDLSKIGAGKFDLQIGSCSLAGVCEASLQMVKGLAQRKGQKINFSMTPEAILVQADARRLKQMLVNLLSNAVKFTPEGGSLGIEVQGKLFEKRVIMTVWDTGIGIKTEDLPRLFQPFVQLDSSLSRQYTGTGLGLSLVERMAALHGGSINVESIPGVGSRFSIILPWEIDAESANPQIGKIGMRLHRALTVDASDVDAEQLTRYLKNLGLSNNVISTAIGAVDLAAQTSPDVILIHLHLPDKPGLDLLAELKSDARTKAIPVIIMSVEEKRREAKALGAAGYLVRPLSQADLQVELQRIVVQMSVPERTPNAMPVVLLADDHEIALGVIADFLSAHDFQVITARSGIDVLERVGDIHPDILLIDIQMPGMDGLEVIRRIRKHPEKRISSLPIIALTALAMTGDRERCIAAGANEYLSKPLHLEKMIETIRELCK